MPSFGKIACFSFSMGVLGLLAGCGDSGTEASLPSVNTVTDTFYNPQGEEVGRVSVTPSPNGSGERGTFEYSGDQGSAQGTVSTSEVTGSPVETFYDTGGDKIGSSSMSESEGASTKTFYDSKGKELGSKTTSQELESE